MARLTEAVSAVTPLGDALREPAKAPRKRRESTTPEPLDVAWSCPCHGMRFDDLREIYLHIRAELQARADVRDSRGYRRIALCGTRGGWFAHYRKGEEPCEPCRAVDRARSAAWYAANKEKRRAKDRVRYAEDRERIRVRKEAWRSRNREAVNAAERARYAKRKAAQQQDAA